jgi:plastocyanin
MRARTSTRRAGATLVLVVALGGTACAGDDGPAGVGRGPSLPSPDASDAATEPAEVAFSDLITIEERRYRPADFFVAPAREVRVVNRDDEAHTVTSFDGSFDVRVAPRGEAEFLSPEPGVYAYSCRFHPEMGAEFEVR